VRLFDIASTQLLQVGGGLMDAGWAGVCGVVWWG